MRTVPAPTRHFAPRAAPSLRFEDSGITMRSLRHPLIDADMKVLSRGFTLTLD